MCRAVVSALRVELPSLLPDSRRFHHSQQSIALALPAPRLLPQALETTFPPVPVDVRVPDNPWKRAVGRGPVSVSFTVSPRLLLQAAVLPVLWVRPP